MSAIPFHSPLITKRSLFAGLRIKCLVQKNDLIQMGLCLQLHLKPALSPPQAKSPHGGVMCSHSAHLMQPCCDFKIQGTCLWIWGNIFKSTNLMVHQIWGSLSFQGHSILGVLQFWGPFIKKLFGVQFFWGSTIVGCKIFLRIITFG